MRGRREEHNIIGRGRRVHSFIQNNFVSTKPSVFAPLQTSSCCYCGRGPQWEVMTSSDEKNDSGCYDSKRKGLFTVSFSLHYACLCTALVMWSRGQRSQSTQSKTRLCTNVFRRQTLGNGYSLFIISLQTKPTFLFKAEISPHSVNWVS